MGKRTCWLALACALLLPVAANAAARPYRDFLRDVTDLERLARPPEPGVTCRQFSSYDRASVVDEQGNLVRWDANADAGNFLRQDPEGAVLAEMDGPGCIVRIWSANPKGTLKVYIDGDDTPTFEADFAKLTAGQVPGVPEPIVGMHSSGANCFLPMPYQTKCKVVVQDPGSLYYHVDYRTYPGGRVQPFHWPLSAGEQRDVAALAARLAKPEQAVPGRRAGVDTGQGTLDPGASIDLFDRAGPGAIVRLTLTADLPADVRAARQALRGLLLTGTFDGAAKPQIWAPAGDFFGTGPGANQYRGLPCGCTPDGFYSNWYMPYGKHATLTLKNDGPEPVTLSWQVERAALPRGWRNLMYFHARWRREAPNTTFDWPLLEATGPGRLVGVALAVWNPDRGWWGEGDEKVWVDGEKFPSWFGTGSEDYFGYAWCNPALFSHALHAQPLCEGPGNGGYTSVNRWHIADNIPWQQSYRMTIENYGRDKDYACVTYWYAPAAATDFFEPDTAESRLTYHEPTPPFKIEGAIEGETMQIVGRQLEGEVGPQVLSSFGGKWSDETHLWLRPSGPGWVDLALPVKEAGEREVVVYLTKAIDYGIVQVSLSGQAAGPPIDCFHDGVVPTGPISLGRHQLAPGAVLRIAVTGKNEQAVGYMAGLDCVVLK